MINVIGLGYIGLPTALMFATHGQEVIGSDYDTQLVEQLCEGHVTFEENGLEALFIDACERGIKFTTEYVSASAYIVTVPTPYDKQSRKIDVRYVVNAVERVLDVAPEGAILIVESTIAPGTFDKVIRPLVQKHNCKIHLAHAPERIIPGNMLYELKHNARTVGSDDAAIGAAIRELYASFCKGRIAVTSIRTAEMTKVVENTYRDINIAFANELAKICRSDGMDVYEIINVANQHPRVNILMPGPGVGGHCISVDPWFLVGDYPGLANIVLAARKINDSMPEFVISRISEVMEAHGITDVSRVGLYGLAYKENVDDIRESPTLQLLHCMKTHLARGIRVYDPWIKHDVVENQYHEFDAFCKGLDLIVIMVGHDELRHKAHLLNQKIVLDTRKTGVVANCHTL